MKNIIILMGGQGVGKGTFAGILCNDFPYNYIETGALFRAMPVDCEIAKLIAAGNLVPDSELFKLIESKLDAGADTLIDGFPRTLPQAKWFIENYSTRFNIQIIYLNLPREIMIQRIKKRLADGGNRADDNDMSAILRRLDTFSSITMPVVEWFRETNVVKFSDVDVSGDLDKNIELIRNAICN